LTTTLTTDTTGAFPLKTFTLEIQIEFDEDHPMVASEGDIAEAIADLFQDFIYDDGYMNMVTLHVKEVQE
jgi:hypothetical protein